MPFTTSKPTQRGYYWMALQKENGEYSAKEVVYVYTSYDGLRVLQFQNRGGIRMDNLPHNIVWSVVNDPSN